MSIPYRIGTPIPDGGLRLNKAEREWLAEVVKRVDTANAEVQIDTSAKDRIPARLSEG